MSISANFPNVRPSLLLDFANSQQLDPRVTFSRSTTAPYYDGKTSVLAEQNLQIYSQAFNTAGWAQGVGGLAQSTTLTTAPDGTTTGTAIYPTTAGTNSGARLYTLSGSSAVAIYTFSFYAKPNGLNFVFLNQPGNAGSGVAWFNLGTGALGTINATWTATITSAGNGWYRCTATPNSSIAQGSSLSIAPCDSDNSLLATTSGTNGIQLWGVQIEQRSSVTDYNATTTSAITNYIPQLLTAPINSPRFDFNPTTGESLGLLIEQSSTNLLIYSQDFSNAAWSKTNATITTASDIAPDGTQTMQLYVPNNGATIGAGTNLYKSVTLSAGSIALSVYAKAKELTTFTLQDGSGNGGNFNLSTVTPINVGTGVATITSVGNGVYRCVATIASEGANPNWFFYPTAGTANGYNGIYIWGAQLEALAFPTSYIPTPINQQVTRASDNVSMTGTNFSSWYNASEGTIYSDSVAIKTNSPIYTMSTGVVTNGFYCYSSDTSNYVFYVFLNTVQIVQMNAGTSLTAKNAFSVKTNNYIGSVNGNTPTTVTTGTIPVPNQLNIGFSPANNSYLNGRIKKFAYYSIAFTSSQNQALTGS